MTRADGAPLLDPPRVPGPDSEPDSGRDPWTCPGRDLPIHELTQRERDVLALLALAQSNAEIAAELYLGINSVKTYIRSAYRRIGVQTRSEAIVWAITHGLAPDVVRRAVEHQSKRAPSATRTPGTS